MEPPKEPVSGGGLNLAAPKPGVGKGSPSKPKPVPARASPNTRAKAPLAKKAPPAKTAPKAAKKAAQIPPKAVDTVDAAGEKEQERPLVDGAAACSASQPLQPITEAGETPSPSRPPDGAREEVSQPQLPVMEPAEPSSLPPASTPLPPESPSGEPAAKALQVAATVCPKEPLPAMEPPKEPVSGEKVDLSAPKPGVGTGSPSTPKPAPAKASPKTRAKAPLAKKVLPAKKAAEKAAQISPKVLDTIDDAGGKEQERPLVDGVVACSASQPLQPVREAGETPSPSRPPDGTREELSQPQLPVMEPAQPSSLPPASTPLPPESPSGEPAAKALQVAATVSPKEHLPAMEPPKKLVSGEKVDLSAPKPGVGKGSPSAPKPVPARASPNIRAKAPLTKKVLPIKKALPAKKATKKAAQIPPKALDPVCTAGGKEQERPLVDGAAACSASQPAQPSSLPPASTPLPPESPSEEPAAKRAKPATPEVAVPPIAAGLCPKKAQEPGMQNKQPPASAASDSALHQEQATAADDPTLPSTASSMDILKSVVEGPKDLPLSGDKGGTPDTPTFSGLFCPGLFKTLLQKAKATARIVVDPAPSDPALSDPNNLLFSEPTTEKEEIPCPKLFLAVVQRQWEKPSASPNPGANDRRFYNMTPNLMSALRVPIIDGPVVSLVGNILGGNPEDNLKPEDRRMELTLRKAHQMSAWAVKSALAASFFNRTSLLWLKEIQARIPATDLQTHEDLNNLIAAAEFSADATLHSAKFASKTIGNSVAARRLLWLRYWQTQPKYKWKLAASPFKGDKLFGEALEPLLKETKDKKKILPSTFKTSDHKSLSNVQKPSFRGGNNARSFSQQKRSYFQRANRQSDRADRYKDRSRQQFQSKQQFRDNRSRPFDGFSRDLHSQPSQTQPSKRQTVAGDCSPKRFKEVKSDSRVKKTQQASGIQEIKNPVHTGQRPCGRLPEVNRSHGNIPTRPYIADSPTISMDTLRKSAFPVQGPHKDASYALGSPQDYPYSRPTLSGQPVDRIVSPPAHREPPRHDPGPSGSFRESGIQSQPRQEPLVSYQKDAPPSSIYRRDIVPSLPVPGPPAQHQRSGEPHPIGPNGASRPRLTIVRQDGVLRLHLSRPTSAYQDPEGTRPVVLRGLANQLQLARAQTMPRSTPTDPDHRLRPTYTDPSRQQSHQGPYEPPREHSLQDIDYRTQDPIGSPPVVKVTQYNHGKHIEETEPSRHRSGSRFSRLESPDGRRTVDRRGAIQHQPVRAQSRPRSLRTDSYHHLRPPRTDLSRQRSHLGPDEPPREHPLQDIDYRRTNPIQSPPVADVTDRNQGKYVRETELSGYRSGGRFSRLESPDRDRDGRRSADRRGTTREHQSARDRSRSRSPRRDRDRRSPYTDSSRKRRH